MPKPPKLAFLTTDYPPDVGGLQEYSLRIARDLPLDLQAVEAGVTSTASAPRLRGAKTRFRFHRGRSRLGALPWSLAASFRHALWGGGDTFLHMQWSTALGSWLLRRCGSRCRYFVLAHGAELIDSNRALNWVKRRVLRDADAVVAGSQATADLLRNLGVSPPKVCVVRYGCESVPPSSQELLGKPGQPLRFACMHRLVPRKGTSLLIEALAGLKDQNWILNLVGQGELRAQLMHQAVEVGLADRIHFIRPKPESEKVRFLRDQDLFILPSLPPSQGNNHVEGLGIGLLEAQAAGVAVLAARTGGIPEALREEKTGWLFEAGNVSDLREKLRLACARPESLVAMGQAGPAWISENFSWEKTLRRLAEILGGSETD